MCKVLARTFGGCAKVLGKAKTLSVLYILKFDSNSIKHIQKYEILEAGAAVVAVGMLNNNFFSLGLLGQGVGKPFTESFFQGGRI